jgi:hypothetical protein
VQVGSTRVSAPLGAQRMPREKSRSAVMVCRTWWEAAALFGLAAAGY